MTENQQRGRRALAAYITAVLLLEIIVIVFASTRGLEYLPSRVVRFALAGALYLWLYQGSNIARAISFLLCGLAGVQAVLLALFKSLDIVTLAVMGSMALLYLSFAAVLVASPAVRAFLDHQRNSLATKPPNNFTVIH
jgi:hypothetical protein